MRKWLAALLVLALAPCVALADTTFGTGWGYASFISDAGEVTESNVAAFLEHSVALNDGKASGEYDKDGMQIWYPDWYLGLGYTIQADEDPLQGIYLMPQRRVGEIWIGAGPQMEIWNESLFGATKIAGGVRAILELPQDTVGDFPLRLSFSATRGNDLTRLDLSVMLTAQ